MAVFLTAVIFWSRGIGGNAGQAWDRENTVYGQIDQFLVSQGATNGDIVMVANPPGFFLASGNPAIAVPDGDIETLLTVAKKYQARFIILETGSVPTGLLPVYDNPKDQPDLIFLGEIEHARIFLLSQR